MRPRVWLGACWAAILVLLLGMPGHALASDSSFATAKPVVPTVAKEVSMDGDEWSHEADATVGDRLLYRIQGTLPGRMREYEELAYSFVDICDNGIAISLNSVRVSRRHDGSLMDVTNSFEVAMHDGSCEVVCDDLLRAFPDLSESDTLVLTYEARLLPIARCGLSNPNRNSCHIRYATRNGEDEMTPSSVAFAYSYMVDVRKVADDTQEPLEGACFALRNTEGLWLGDGGWTSDETRRTEAVTDTSGNALLGPVGVGTYELVEVKAPAGYDVAHGMRVRLARSENVEVGASLAASAKGAEVVDVEAKTGTVAVQVFDKALSGRQGGNAPQSASTKTGPQESGQADGTAGPNMRSGLGLAVTGDVSARMHVLYAVLASGLACMACGLRKRRDSQT